MRVFSIGAGGYRAVGLMVVAAETAERAAELANETTDTEQYHLTYYAHNAQVCEGVSDANSMEYVITSREYGHPELPSSGSGVKVTF